jgi:ubiquinone/menaquinone biosynthesis C-methylase UbiE
MTIRNNDLENATEIARRLLQERLAAWILGGVFPERTHLGKIHDILDIGCGPGGWGIDVARRYHGCTLVGIDGNKAMIEYARTLLQMHHLKNARFEVMSTYDKLPFEAHCFDLINLTFGIRSVFPACVPLLLQECKRVLRSGGIIRFTEADYLGTTNSTAQMQFRRSCMRFLEQDDAEVSPLGELQGNISWIETLLQKVGCQTIHMRASPLDISFGTEYHESYTQHLHILWTQMIPRLHVFALQEDLDRLYSQLLEETTSEAFQGTSSLSIVWGEIGEIPS